MIIIGDSSTLPHPSLKVEDTWVDRIINKYRTKYTIYTFLIEGLTTKLILKDLKENVFNQLRPDVLLFQVGVVDYPRKAMSRIVLRIGCRIVLFNRFLRWFAQKYHYGLSRIGEYRNVSLEDFEKNISEIIDLSLQRNIKLGFIRIIGAGKYLRKMVYNCQIDVRIYNQALENLCKKSGFTFIDPYVDHNPDAYTIDTDGYHPNKLGSDMIVESVSHWLEKL